MSDRVKRRGAATQGRTPPGPAGLPLVGSLREWGRNPLQFFTDLERQYGDVVRFRMGTWRFTLLSNPEHIKYVLQENNPNYDKNRPTFFIKRLLPLLGQGIATTNGAYWLHLRRLVQPAFHRQRVARFGTIMTDDTAALIQRWQTVAESGQPVDIDADLRHLTLDILVHTLTPLGANLERETEEVRQIIEHWMTRTKRIPTLLGLLFNLPTPENRRFRQAVAKLDRIIYRLIAERRQAGGEGDDLLSLLIQARDEESGQGLTDREIRDQVATIFTAGFETTATALSFTFYLLSQHPEVEARLRAELAASLGGRTPTFADLPNLTYTRMVFEEAMRLYPPNWALRRIPIVDDEVGGYLLPAGSTVLLSTWVMHRHPAYWEDPLAFDPERFSPERAAGRPRFAYFPFGGGPRQCIGNYFATVEAQLIIAMIVQTYQLDLLPGHVVEPKAVIPLRPRHGLLMTLHRADAGIERADAMQPDGGMPVPSR